MALTKRTKAGYGAAELGLAGGELLLQLYLLEFYVRGAGLSPILAGTALAVAIFWDAVTDPVMGGLVDRTQTRWGRFAPYLFGGGLMFGLGLAMLFNPPEFGSQALLFLYLLFTYIFVNTGLTVIGVPHIAMGGVLSPDTHERTELYGWRLVFGTVGLFAGILSPLIAANLLQADVRAGVGLLQSRGLGSIIMASVVVLTACITVFATFKRSRDLPAPEDAFNWRDLVGNIGRILRNPVFAPFFIAFILVAMGRTMNCHPGPALLQGQP
jgi:GPH family glycoside/pentoside/hexuronide:cation symporter